jgi:hypothetical protein
MAIRAPASRVASRRRPLGIADPRLFNAILFVTARCIILQLQCNRKQSVG